MHFLLIQKSGQYQINIATFTKEFNAKSDQIYEKGIPLNVKIYKYGDKTYDVDIRGPILGTMIKNITSEAGEILTEDLYDLCLAHMKKVGGTPEVAARNVMGYLNSCRPRPKIVDKASVPKEEKAAAPKDSKAKGKAK
jgi:ribosomal protein L11